MRKSNQKAAFLEQLQKTPIIQAACERSGLPRTTFYRWLKDDPRFAKDVEEAMRAGRGIVNDLAESQLISAVKDRNVGAIRLWLTHNHEVYSPKLKLYYGGVVDDTLTEEQEVLLGQALELLSGAEKGGQDEN